MVSKLYESTIKHQIFHVKCVNYTVGELYLNIIILKIQRDFIHVFAKKKANIILNEMLKSCIKKKLSLFFFKILQEAFVRMVKS